MEAQTGSRLFSSNRNLQAVVPRFEPKPVECSLPASLPWLTQLCPLCQTDLLKAFSFSVPKPLQN